MSHFKVLTTYVWDSSHIMTGRKVLNFFTSDLDKQNMRVRLVEKKDLEQYKQLTDIQGGDPQTARSTVRSDIFKILLVLVQSGPRF